MLFFIAKFCKIRSYAVEVCLRIQNKNLILCKRKINLNEYMYKRYVLKQKILFYMCLNFCKLF